MERGAAAAESPSAQPEAVEDPPSKRQRSRSDEPLLKDEPRTLKPLLRPTDSSTDLSDNTVASPSALSSSSSVATVATTFAKDGTPLGAPHADPLADLTDHATLTTCPLSVVIFGASGDLARKKLFPSLYQLCVQGHLPKHLNIVGYGRNRCELKAFVQKQCVNVPCTDERWAKDDFVAQISYHAGGYDDAKSYAELDARLRAYELSHPSGRPGNRLFCLSVPPTVFGTVAEMISASSRAANGGFTRLLIEKPFGRDSASFHELNELTARHFKETQLFRIDHYLGKEILLNISTLRWANSVFEPLWNAQHIESVQITFKENLGLAGRGGYFDGFGIVRDVIQNHLLQAFMFVAMEPPADMCGPSIIEAKANLLRSVRTLDMQNGDVFLGQFTAGGGQPGYLDDETVPPNSTCPTFAACVLTVDSDRWRGVPFLLSAGKGLDERLCELRVRFRPQPYNRLMGVDAHNELVMRVQPDEALYMVAVAKTPGICAGVGRDERRTPVAMGLRYATQFGDGSPFKSGDAYERMLLNASRGDQALSVSAAELTEAWRIFTPMLHQIDDEKPAPVLHPFGQQPDGYAEWTERHGIDIAPPARHWSAAEAHAHAAAQEAAAIAAQAAAEAAAEAAAQASDPFSNPGFMY